MKNISEQLVDQQIITDAKNRNIYSKPGDSRWGQLIIPGKDESCEKTDKGLKIVLFASFHLGYLLLETLKKFEKYNPDRLSILGLVTDDPASPHAKISVKRRIWRFYGEKQIIGLEAAMIESALVFGIPVYTGEVKCNYFRKLLAKWDPETILISVFGQIIDTPIIDYPAYGIYNFHPADLAAGYGAGPRPFQDLIERNAKTSKLTIHQLTEQTGSCPVVGQSSPINVRFEDGSISDNILVLDDKMLKPVDIMRAELVKTLILKKEEDIKGKVERLDFSKHFTEDYKKELMKPVKSKVPSDTLSMPSGYVDYHI